MIFDTDGCVSIFFNGSTSQPLLVVHHKHVIYIVHILGLLAHLLDALRHRPVFVDHDHLRAHQAAGGVLVILHQVDDVAGLLHVVELRQYLLLVLLVELLNQVHGVVRLHVVDLLGYDLVGEVVKQFSPVVLIEFEQHVGRRLLVKKLIEKLGLVQVQILIQFGNIGRMETRQLLGCGLHIPAVYDLADQLQIFGTVLFHACKVTKK